MGRVHSRVRRVVPKISSVRSLLVLAHKGLDWTDRASRRAARRVQRWCSRRSAACRISIHTLKQLLRHGCGTRAALVGSRWCNLMHSVAQLACVACKLLAAFDRDPARRCLRRVGRRAQCMRTARGATWLALRPPRGSERAHLVLHALCALSGQRMCTTIWDRTRGAPVRVRTWRAGARILDVISFTRSLDEKSFRARFRQAIHIHAWVTRPPYRLRGHKRCGASIAAIDQRYHRTRGAVHRPTRSAPNVSAPRKPYGRSGSEAAPAPLTCCQHVLPTAAGHW